MYPRKDKNTRLVNLDRQEKVQVQVIAQRPDMSVILTGGEKPLVARFIIAEIHLAVALAGTLKSHHWQSSNQVNIEQ